MIKELEIRRNVIKVLKDNEVNEKKLKDIIKYRYSNTVDYLISQCNSSRMEVLDEVFGSSQNYYQNYQSDLGKMNTKHLDKLSNILGIDQKDLLVIIISEIKEKK
tara:strand:- start:8006 stop:8320 length:315 start_codon:yes stop_codon:yes gene_type:complete